MENNSPLSEPAPKRGPPWLLLLLLRWGLGIYLILTSLNSVLIFFENLRQIRYAQEVDPHLQLVPIYIALAFKVVSGVLLILRSKWLLVAVPLWLAAFAYTFLNTNTFGTLPTDFFSGIGFVACILLFVVWLHDRGRLK
jgi:uncharacterized membrane protein YphA (DoxX/SURF4 family)